MRMLLLNSSLAFFFPPPDLSEQAHPEIRHDAEAGSQAGGQVRNSHPCWGSPEISLLQPCKEEVIPWVIPGKGLASSAAASITRCKFTALQKSAAS